MGNKLFVIGGMHISSCKVFDSCSRKFTTITSEIKLLDLEKNYFKAFCIGSNIVVFHHFPGQNSVIYMYDVNVSRWSPVDCRYTKNYCVPSCIKYYAQ